MCGIIGYTGFRPACSVILEGLERLEYRGYDSSGILIENNGLFNVIKRKGKIEQLKKAINSLEKPDGTCGIGHTRWATHGGPSDSNSHPHGTVKVMLVHNGIIENYRHLKSILVENGYDFSSETDSEIAACYLDYCYNGDPVSSIATALNDIQGSYAFVIMFSDHPGTLYAVRKDGPLIVAPGDGENFLASDVTAVIQYTDQYFTLDDGEIAIVKKDSYSIVGFDNAEHKKNIQKITWTIEQAQKEGFDHYMLKEINEQPNALRQTLYPRIKEKLPNFECDQIPDEFWSKFERIKIVGCGTAMHAGLIGREIIEHFSKIPVEVEIASEFRYRNPILKPNDLVIIISQSGETADSLAALRLAKSMNIATLAIVNVAGSSIAREADKVIFTYAGPEISVASTKAYSVQIAILYLIAVKLAIANKELDENKASSITETLYSMPEVVKRAISDQNAIKKAAESFIDSQHLFFLGRGLDYALASEGSLKLKEISYIHCEAYAAGELKHGTISLITEGMPVIALSSQNSLAPKMLSNIREVKARGATVTLITNNNNEIKTDEADFIIMLEPADDLFMPFPVVAVLQLIAYYTALYRKCDIDQPRNLAKSVTVE